jgi:hypothetical protein
MKHNIHGKVVVFLTVNMNEELPIQNEFLNTFSVSFSLVWSRGSSVGIVSDYGLDDRAIEVRSPTEDFSSSLCVQTGTEAHPASCIMGTGGPFPGRKARPGRDADHSPPSSADVKHE